jgi:hypothetical protein
MRDLQCRLRAFVISTALVLLGLHALFAANDLPSPNGLLTVTVKEPAMPNPAFVGQTVEAAFGLIFTKHSYRQEAQTQGIASQKLTVRFEGGGGQITAVTLIGFVPIKGGKELEPFGVTLRNLKPGETRTVPGRGLTVKENAEGDELVITGGPGSPVIVSVEPEGYFKTPGQKDILLHAEIRPAGAIEAAIGAALALLQEKDLTVEILDANNKDAVIKTKQVTVVGKNISLKAKIVPAPQKNAMVAYLWAIPGPTVKSYLTNDEKGEVTSLDDKDAKKDAISYFWIDGGDRKVDLKVTVNGVEASKSVEFTVERPTMNMFTSKLTTDAPDTFGVALSNPNLPGSGLELHFGTDESPGITWLGKVTAPKSSGGTIAFAQVLSTVAKKTDNDGKTETLTSEGQFVLDAKFPYNRAKEMPVKAGQESGEMSAKDTPGARLSNSQSFRSSDTKFKTYLMFKPDGKDSIWVTLRELEWFWKGSGVRVAKDQWKFSDKPSPDSSAKPPAGEKKAKPPESKNSTTLPVWKTNVTDLDYK